MKMLLTGAVTWTEEQINEIRNLGNEIMYIQDERIPLAEQNIDIMRIEGVICNGLFLYNNIDDFKNLKYIQLTSAGFDRVPMEYVQEHHIKIYNARGVYSIPMAEFAVGGVLQICKKSRIFYENQKQHRWEKYRDIQELSGKTVCIVGCGNVGTECAKRFSAFGCKIIGIDLYTQDNINYEKILQFDSFENVLSESDIIVLTLPLTDKTKHLLNIHRLKLMKPTAILVNIARGAIVDTEALIQVMPQIGGAVLDVFEEEPLSADCPLWNMEKVIITPHNSFVGEKNRERLQKVIVEGLKMREMIKI